MASHSSPLPHDRSGPKEEDDPVDQLISRTGCSALHYAIQECMAEHEDWRKCKKQVQEFRECMMPFQKARMEQLVKCKDSATENV
ncbi:cytochrome c oxidase assembly factor 4 homolog, mitochondrial [Pangasianodon hypophthalmus]|uniref:cytochrome c oxidase assembly factor 4 homolog, mitochondrial n=1 Tax=Pangasianodon hypophthalmus TaxID=310915 RepID=UPI000EFF9786|nr:cytochrome c oxidase assembly factor 4 homolog, mitochondrial [Pangasianodon hypophthalmus]XP_053097481.1 cytochrome c oxidase assembly factor 4 homolog, mitochondrial [Pangasianodon hypophthalmus]XP_053097482.1 cytochrome c oxidase assembly factor 4 homolog, mitochondrial [Pangasianodon hypophthalmus]